MTKLIVAFRNFAKVPKRVEPGQRSQYSNHVMDGQAGVQIPIGAKKISLLADCVKQQAPHFYWVQWYFLRVKRPGRHASHSPQSI
jgi:hypothetical protein